MFCLCRGKRTNKEGGKEGLRFKFYRSNPPFKKNNFTCCDRFRVLLHKNKLFPSVTSPPADFFSPYISFKIDRRRGENFEIFLPRPPFLSTLSRRVKEKWRWLINGIGTRGGQRGGPAALSLSLSLLQAPSRGPLHNESRG